MKSRDDASFVELHVFDRELHVVAAITWAKLFEPRVVRAGRNQPRDVRKRLPSWSSSNSTVHVWRESVCCEPHQGAVRDPAGQLARRLHRCPRPRPADRGDDAVIIENVAKLQDGRRGRAGCACRKRVEGNQIELGRPPLTVTGKRRASRFCRSAVDIRIESDAAAVLLVDVVPQAANNSRSDVSD